MRLVTLAKSALF